MKAKILILSSLFVMAAMPLAQKGPESFTGKKLPSFTAKTVAGKKFTNADLKGKVVIMDFWATWCGPCRKLSPTMQSLHAKYGKKGLLVIGANVEGSPTDPTPAVKKYASEHKYSYTFTVGNEKLSSQLFITGIPTVVVLDKKGTVKKALVGILDITEPALEKIIKPLL